MKNFILITCLATSLLVALNPASAAEIKKDGITGKTVLAGVLSLLIWPGIGQAVKEKSNHPEWFLDCFLYSLGETPRVCLNE